MIDIGKLLRGLIVGAGVLAVIAAGTVSAQDSSLKIGYVNANKIISDAPQGITAFEELQEEFAPREEELRKIREELSDIEVELRSSSDDTEKSRLEVEARKLNRNLERDTIELEEDFNYRRNEELAKLQNTVSDVILRMAKDNEFDLIVQAPVVWASDRINITDEILEELERMHKQ